MLHSLEGPLPLHQSDSSTDRTPSPLTCAAAIPATRPSNVYKEIINCIRQVVQLTCSLLRHNQRVGSMQEDTHFAVHAVNPHPVCRACF